MRAQLRLIDLIKQRILTGGHHCIPLNHQHVAQVQFYFNNAPVIENLLERGEAIKDDRWREVERINKQLTKICSNDSEQLGQPKGAFITFDHNKTRDLFV